MINKRTITTMILLDRLQIE